MTAVWAAIGLLAVLLAVTLVLFRGRRPGAEVAALQEATRGLSEQVGQLAQLVASQLAGLSDQVGRQLSATAELLQRQEGDLGKRLDGVSGVVADVRERLGALDAAGRRIAELAQDISSLQDILRAPKARGALGEWLLADLLAQVLPQERFRLQHTFRGGETVDAAIFLEGLAVPVDAKFPLASFQRLVAAEGPEEHKRHKRALLRDARRHVDAVAQKYIRPGEGTADFALMYVPAEGVFLELITPAGDQGEDFLDYAWARRVVPCSPNTFYAYLQSVALGLRGLSLARDVQRVLGQLRELQGALEGLLKESGTLGTHLRNARAKFEDVDRGLQELAGRLARLAAEEER
ncbi:MAG: DNA recombination protein RmuC [Candidatus Bipolaricaulaceae bacterium]